MDLDLLRLQYEILNIPLAVIAKRTDLPLYLLEKEAADAGWKVLWPGEDEAPLEFEEGEDRFSIAADAYIERAKKRLIVFSLAKEALLSSRYLELEYSILNKAQAMLDTMEGPAISVTAIRSLASLYKDMSKVNISAGANNATAEIDGTAVPTLIVRDLSGQKGR